MKTAILYVSSELNVKHFVVEGAHPELHGVMINAWCETQEEEDMQRIATDLLFDENDGSDKHKDLELQEWLEAIRQGAEYIEIRFIC